MAWLRPQHQRAGTLKKPVQAAGAECDLEKYIAELYRSPGRGKKESLAIMDAATSWLGACSSLGST